MNHSDAAPSEIVAVVSACLTPTLLLSADLTVLAASNTCLEFFGVGREELIGQDLRSVLGESDSIDALLASLGAAMRARQPHQAVAGLFRATAAKSRDRHQRLLRFNNTPILSEAGEARWVIVQAEEPEGHGQSKRSNVEADLRVSEAQLRSILRTVPDAMIIIDERGLIETLSTTAEKLFGYAATDVVGKNVRLFMPSPHREAHDGYLERYLRTGERRIIGIGRVVVGQRRDGTTFPMHLTIGEMRSGQKHYFTGFIRDLTDQHFTEQRVRELQAEVTHMSRFTALGEMASAIAHEINQPLMAINNYLSGCMLMLDNPERPPVRVLQEALDKAAAQALRAGQIIRRLREFVARGDSDRRIERLSKMIQDASTLALLGTQEHGIELSFRLHPLAERVMVDRIQIQQVLVNLIRNAAESLAESPPPRELMVKTTKLDDDFVQVSVVDSGLGLAPDVRANLFQPFITTKQQGMGLGLSISRTIIEAHGGKIWAERRSGRGTVFCFTLRIVDEELDEADDV